MICTRLGTKVERFIGKSVDEHGGVWVKVKLEGMDGEREIFIGDFRADGGMREVEAAIGDTDMTMP